MPERFLDLGAWGELSTEKAQAWFDELMASKSDRISQVSALLARNGLDTSNPQRPGFWREVTLWLDEHAEYDEAQMARSGRSAFGAGIPLIWRAVAADIDLWYATVLIQRSEGKYEWVLPLEEPQSSSFQSLCFQAGMWGHPVPVLGGSLLLAYSDYPGRGRVSASDHAHAMEMDLAMPTPGRPVIVEDDDVDEYGLSAVEREAYEEAWLAEQPVVPPKPPKKWIR